MGSPGLPGNPVGKILDVIISFLLKFSAASLFLCTLFL